MHRFGRTAQQKTKDRWGGSLILATVLALVGAYYLGNWVNGVNRPTTAGNEDDAFLGGLMDPQGTGSGAAVAVAMKPADFQLHFVQVAALYSEGRANSLVKSLGEKGYSATVSKSGSFFKVIVGPYTSATGATSAKSQIIADGLAKEGMPTSLTFGHNPTVVPALSGGTNGTNLKAGLESVNSYLQEVAVWMEHSTSGQAADTSVIATRGRELSTLATAMKKNAATDPALQKVVDMATAASANAAALQSAAKSSHTSPEYQNVMKGYMSLLDQYHSYTTAKASN